MKTTPKTPIKKHAGAWFMGALLVWVLVACGGGGSAVGDAPSAPTRIEIAPNALLLTATGQKKSLAAKVFDAAGNTVQAQVEWTSSHPENIAVDASGAVTAIGDGSSQIIARVGTVQSPPLLAVHTQLPAEAVLLTDANIVGEPEETTPGAVASMDNTYRVQLTGVPPPAVGSLLINTEGKVVAGRVRAVQTTSGVHLVTLALAPAREMFPQLNINEVIDLNQAEVAIPAEIRAQYDVLRQGNTFTFTPKPGQVSLTASLIQKQPMASGDVTSSGVRTTKTAAATAPTSIVEFKRGPFNCKPALDGAAGAGSQIIALTSQPLFAVTLNPKLDVLFTAAHGPERFVIHSEPSVSIEAGLTALIAMEGKVTCEVELFVIKIPFGGPVALIVGGQLPVGAGLELGGKITAANLSLSAKATAKTTADIGFACPAGTNCAIVNQVGKLDVSFTPTADAPGFEDVRFEPSLSVYAFVKASIGNPFMKSLRFDAFKVKAGPALKGNFAPQSTQIADPAYQSNYKLMGEIKAGADTEFIGLAAFFGLNNVAENLIEIPFEIATTPIGVVTADKAQFVAGDTVKFKVKLDPTKTDFFPLIGPYNVQRILLVRHSSTVDAQTISSVDASKDQQTEFDLTFIANDAGKADEFHAFVVTKLLPFDLFALELGQVACDAAACASVSQTFAGTYLSVTSTPREDGLGRRFSGDGTTATSATFRLRRNPDASWELLSVSGEFRQSHFELCDLQETILFTQLASIFESPEGNLAMTLRGPATGVTGQRFSANGCSLVSIDLADRAVPGMVRQLDGRYFFEQNVTFPNGFGGVDTVFERAELIPQ